MKCESCSLWWILHWLMVIKHETNPGKQSWKYKPCKWGWKYFSCNICKGWWLSRGVLAMTRGAERKGGDKRDSRAEGGLEVEAKLAKTFLLLIQDKVFCVWLCQRCCVLVVLWFSMFWILAVFTNDKNINTNIYALQTSKSWCYVTFTIYQCLVLYCFCASVPRIESGASVTVERPPR